ncbi:MULTISPECIES: hypothetical protein [Deinococcus]|uniref:Restriction endonuclease n=1 Tax=Deinococcus rufus TaxID=2136097 RepID=A0ABV7Z6F1_9DEIO|nr:hypothetical protein [Deinococcus sp. AB2017081]WQE97167.1 hypothetical protein U2P90_19005 [Deinococcus sp. AB2017081]
MSSKRVSRIPPDQRRNPRATRPPPSTIDEIGERLNPYDLTDLLTLSALFNVSDEPLQGKVPAARTLLVFALRRLFLLAVLRSKAAEYKTQRITARELDQRWTECMTVDGLHMPEERDTLFTLLLPLMANQLRHQNITLAARAQQVYGHLIASAPQGKKYLDVDQVFADRYGLSLVDLLRFIILLEAWQLSCGEGVDQALHLNSQVERMEVWFALVEGGRPWRLQHLQFTAERFTQALRIPRAVVDAALACLSATVPELRAWQDSHMHLGLTDTPQTIPFALDHRPLVRLKNGQYVLPEGSSLRIAVSHTLLTLLDAAIPADKQDAYNNTRGKALETYLLHLFQDAFPPPARVVSEREYWRTTRERIKGPDLLLLDPRDDRPILIEAKATRTRPTTAPDPTAPRLKRNYGAAFEALHPDKAGRKISDLRAHLSEYKDVQTQIDAASGRPLVIALVHDLPPRAGRLLGRHLRQYPADPLNNASYDMLLMDLIELEMAVHQAKTTGHSLRAILENEIQGVANERCPETHVMSLDKLPEADPEIPLYCMRYPFLFEPWAVVEDEDPDPSSAE